MKPERVRWLRTHWFRVWTMIATWIGLVAAYYYRPEWLTWWLRTTTAGIEKVSDTIPYPWGDRAEIFLRFLGGSFWVQIALAIVIVRVIAWLLGHGCRHGWRLVKSTKDNLGRSYELKSYHPRRLRG
jgi:Na+/H+-dicarboxylate symporter